MQAFFGLPDSEELLEKFQCTLVQSYACTNNHFTTPRLVGAAPLCRFAYLMGCLQRHASSRSASLAMRGKPKGLQA